MEAQLDSQYAAMKLDRVWLVNALTRACTSTVVVGAGVRRSVLISMQRPVLLGLHASSEDPFARTGNNWSRK